MANQKSHDKDFYDSLVLYWWMKYWQIKGLHDDEASVNISRSQVWRRRRETHPRLASVFMKSSFKLIIIII